MLINNLLHSYKVKYLFCRHKKNQKSAVKALLNALIFKIILYGLIL